VQDVVATAAASANMGYGSILAKMAHHLVLFFVVIIALSQLGLETYLITDNVSIIIAGIMGIAVLAVGLGGRMAAGNLIGSFYAGQMLKVGDSITIGELSGTVKSVSGVSVVLETKEHKEVIVPSHIILEEVIEKK
jgi:small-conductance mechanosensitive channel